MFFSAKALMFGEDFTTDPVSKALGFCLRSFSKGRLVVNLQLFSQVTLCCLLCAESLTIRPVQTQTLLAWYYNVARVVASVHQHLIRSASQIHCAMQYITLLFIGCISVSSLRGFLRNMRKVITLQHATATYLFFLILLPVLGPLIAYVKSSAASHINS